MSTVTADYYIALTEGALADFFLIWGQKFAGMGCGLNRQPEILDISQVPMTTQPHQPQLEHNNMTIHEILL